MKGTLEPADVEVARYSKRVPKKAASQKDLDQRLAKQMQACGALLSQEAALQQAELDLSCTEIHAPLSSRIGSTPNVKIRTRLADGSLLPETGVVNVVDVQPDPSADTVAIRAQFPNSRELLVDGALVTAMRETAGTRTEADGVGCCQTARKYP